MFSFLKGTVAEAREGVLVLENNGIGYELQVSAETLRRFGQAGKECKIYTYLQVKEDGIALFGFYSREEKGMFEQLITVSGVGCKGALAVLSGVGLSELALCIATGDAKTLTAAKGVGKKTAERIILELKEKVGADFRRDENVPAALKESVGGGEAEDAVLALCALGIQKADAAKCVEKAVAAGAKGLEAVIAQALKSMY